jgi:hypothetical protein
MRFYALSEKFRDLKSKDLGLRVQGAIKHRYDSMKLTSRELYVFEEKIGYQLPDEFKDFLKCFGWGAGPGNGIFSLSDSQYYIKKWGEDLGKKGDITSDFQFTSTQITEFFEKKENFGVYPRIKLQRLDGILPVSHHGGSFYTYLVVKGEEVGKVWGINIENFDTKPLGKRQGLFFLDWFENWLDENLKESDNKKLNVLCREYLDQFINRDEERDFQEEKLFLNKDRLRKFKEEEGISEHTWLSMSHCSMNNLPDKFYEVKGLLGLDLSYNNISGIYSSLKKISSLSYLSLKSNNLKALPDAIKIFKKLKILNASNNRLYSLPDFLGGLEELEYINVSNNRIREIHPGISKLKKLKEIDLSSNKGLFGLNSFIGNKSLESIDLSNCSLLVFPYYITMISSLRKLALIGNEFERLPKEIKDLKKLEILYLNEPLAHHLEENIDVLAELESLKECFIPVIDVMKLPQNILKLKHLKKITFYPVYFHKGKFLDQEFAENVWENLKKHFPNTAIELIY